MLRLCFATIVASASAFSFAPPSLQRFPTTSFRVSRTLSESCLTTKVHRGRSANALTNLQAEIQLFGSRTSRSPLVEWYLNEIDQPYTHRYQYFVCRKSMTIALMPHTWALGMIWSTIQIRLDRWDHPCKRVHCSYLFY